MGCDGLCWVNEGCGGDVAVLGLSGKTMRLYQGCRKGEPQCDHWRGQKGRRMPTRDGS